MRKQLYIAIIFLLCAPAHSYARGEGKKGNEVHFFACLAGDYHINNFDIVNTDAQYAFLKNPNNAGMRAGLEFMYLGRRRVFVSTAIEYNMVGQTLNTGYEAAKAGYTGSNYQFRQYDAFTAHNIDLRFRAGYSAKLAPHYLLEIGAGINVSIVASGKHSDTMLFEDVTGDYYKEPIMYYATGWGLVGPTGEQIGNGTGLNLKGTGQIALRILEPALFNNRSFRVGLEGGYFFAGNFVNKGVAAFYGNNRTLLNQATYTDRHFSLGLSFAVEL